MDANCFDSVLYKSTDARVELKYMSKYHLGSCVEVSVGVFGSVPYFSALATVTLKCRASSAVGRES